MQRHQQHMHTLLLQDSGSLLTWRLVLIQLHWEVPEVVVQGNQCLAFLLSKWKKKKACSFVKQVIWWPFTFSWDVLVKFLNWEYSWKIDSTVSSNSLQRIKNTVDENFLTGQKSGDCYSSWAFDIDRREVFVAHELHLCILYTFLRPICYSLGVMALFFTHLEAVLLLLVLRVLRAFTGLFLGSDKSCKLIRPE